MGLTEIANDVARNSAAKELGRTLLEQLKGCFDEAGFKGIEKHLKKSGFKVTYERYSDGSGDFASAYNSVIFVKNGLDCSVQARLFKDQAPTFHFERSDKPQRFTGHEVEARTPINSPKDAYPLIQDFIMDNLPRLTELPSVAGYVARRVLAR